MAIPDIVSETKLFVTVINISYKFLPSIAQGREIPKNLKIEFRTGIFIFKCFFSIKMFKKPEISIQPPIPQTRDRTPV